MKDHVFILAPDSFKGSMTAREVCIAMEKGIRKVYPMAECIHIPMADGGEGTVQSLVDATDGSIYEQTVTGPLGKPVTANYGILGDKVTAVIEMASASGIGHVNTATRNPLLTTTYGTGELVKACMDKAVFGPQKGATPCMVRELDAALDHYATVIKKQLGKDIKNIPGAGAAGGLGAGIFTFTNARLRQGVEIALDYTNFRQTVKRGDIVFTGEGGIDSQTKLGKTPYGVARAAKQEGKTVIAIAGYVGESTGQLYESGFDAIFSITPGAMTLDEALEQGKENVTRTVENIVRLILELFFHYLPPVIKAVKPGNRFLRMQ